MRRMQAGMRLLLVAAMLAVMLAAGMSSAAAEENAVAKIGETEYSTLDEAVEKAVEGSTIELLTDCELTKGFNKTLTFTGTGKILINKQLTSNGEAWMCFGPVSYTHLDVYKRQIPRPCRCLKRRN